MTLERGRVVVQPSPRESYHRPSINTYGQANGGASASRHPNQQVSATYIPSADAPKESTPTPGPDRGVRAALIEPERKFSCHAGTAQNCRQGSKKRPVPQRSSDARGRPAECRYSLSQKAVLQSPAVMRRVCTKWANTSSRCDPIDYRTGRGRRASDSPSPMTIDNMLTFLLLCLSPMSSTRRVRQ